MSQYLSILGYKYFQEGDRISLIRKSNGTMHYFINGVDQGVASTSCPKPVWGVVDLYGMAVKVTILDRNDPNYCHVFINRRSMLQQFPDMYDEETAEGLFLYDLSECSLEK